MAVARLREQVLPHLLTAADLQEKVEVRQREQVFLPLVGEEQMDEAVLQREQSVLLLVAAELGVAELVVAERYQGQEVLLLGVAVLVALVVVDQ